MIELAFGAVVIIAIVLFLLKDSKKAQENAASYVPSKDEHAQDVADSISPLWSGSSIEEKVESVEESKTQIEERLSKIASPDKGKPFANLSGPDASEVPTYTEVITEDNSEPVVTEKPAKKKRYYKPKKKAPVSEFPIAPVETADKPKRKPYKKRTPKKDE